MRYEFMARYIKRHKVTGVVSKGVEKLLTDNRKDYDALQKQLKDKYKKEFEISDIKLRQVERYESDI